jgi:hypothetical protein
MPAINGLLRDGGSRQQLRRNANKKGRREAGLFARSKAC